MRKKKSISHPEHSKFRKLHKGNLRSIEYKKSATQVYYGSWGLKILQNNRFRVKTLETIRRQLVTRLSKNQSLWVRITPDIPITHKPKEIRMGKGKGAVAHWVARLKAGHILFEINKVNRRRAFYLLGKAARKLGVSYTLVRQKNVIIF